MRALRTTVRLLASAALVVTIPMSCGLLDDRVIGLATRRSGVLGGDGFTRTSLPGRTRGFLGGASSEDYSEIGLVVHRVELTDASGATALVVDSPEGLERNLVALRGPGGDARFDALGPDLPPFTPVSATVDVSPFVRLVDAASREVDLRTVAPSVPRTPEGRARFVVPLPARSALGEGDVVVDFDLDAFASGDDVLPVARESLVTAVQDGAQNEFHVEGLAREVTGPNDPFVIEEFSGARTAVRLREGGLISGDVGGDLPGFESGARVRGHGIRSADRDEVALSFVVVHEAPGLLHRGHVHDRDLVLRELGVLAENGSGFDPICDLLRAGRCVDALGQFQTCAAALATVPDGAMVEAAGHWVEAANRLDALYFRVVPTDEAFVRGVVSTGGAGDLHLDHLSGHRGLATSASGLDVITTPATQLLDASGALLVNRVGDIPAGQRVAVSGRAQGTALVAITLRLE